MWKWKIRKSKDGRYDDQKEKRKIYLQNTTYKTKDRATRSPLKQAMNSGSPNELAVSAPHGTPVILLFDRNLVIRH